MKKKVKQFIGAIVAPRKPALAEAPDGDGISEDLKKQIDDDVLAGRIYTIKEIQKLMRCSYDTARTRVVNEPGVIWFGDPRIPHCVFKNILWRSMKRADAA
jgi:hypothetical protein